MANSVAVIGGSGFVGRHVTQALARSGFDPLILSRGRSGELRSDQRSRVVDIADGAESLREAISGSIAVINAASHVGDDEREQRRVNVDGVRHTVDATTSLGIPLVHVSTAGIYGALAFSGASEGRYPVRPESELSVTRARGDAIASAAGAAVLRPLFITGVGDGHFLLRLLSAHVALGAWIDDGAARLSVASADLVARAAVAAVRHRLDGGAGAVVHVVPDRPIAVRDLLSPILAEWGRLPSRSLSAADAGAALESRGIPARKVAQFAHDYFLSSERLRHLVPDAGSRDVHLTDAALSWYVRHGRSAH